MKKNSFLRLLLAVLVLLSGILFNYGQLPEIIVPLGHQTSIRTIAFSPDEKTLASGDESGVIKLWDLATGNEKGDLEGHTGSVLSIIFTPDGKQLISASVDETIKIWDITTRREIKTLRGHTLEVNSIALHPNGKMFLSASEDTTIRLWDLETGKELKTLEKFGEAKERLTFSPDGNFFAAVVGKSIQIWNTQAAISDDLTSEIMISEMERDSTAEKAGLSVGDIILNANGRVFGQTDELKDFIDSEKSIDFQIKRGDKNLSFKIEKISGSVGVSLRKIKSSVVKTLFGHDKKIVSIAFSPDGKRLASTGEDETVKVWNPETGEQIWKSDLEDDGNTVSFMPDGQTLAVGTDARVIVLFEAATGKELLPLFGHVASASAFTKNGMVLAAAGYDGTIEIWNPRTGKRLKTLEGKIENLDGVSLSSNGQLLALKQDNKFNLFDLAQGNLVGSYPLFPHFEKEDKLLVNDLSFDNSNKAIALTKKFRFGFYGYGMDVWDLTSGEGRKIESGLENSQVMLEPDSSRLALYSGTAVYFYDYRQQKVLDNLLNFTYKIDAASISSDGKYLAIGRGKIGGVWNHNPHEKTARFTYWHEEEISKMDFSPDGKLLASYSKDGMLKVWSVEENRLLLSADTETSYDTDLAFSPGNKTIFYTDSFGKIKALDLQSGTIVKTFQSSKKIKGSFAISPDGKVLIAADENRVVVFLSVETGECLAQLIYLRDENWFLLDKDGRYDGTKNAVAKMYYLSGNNLTPLVSNPKLTSTPDLLAKVSTGVRQAVAVVKAKPAATRSETVSAKENTGENAAAEKTDAQQTLDSLREMTRGMQGGQISGFVEHGRKLVTEHRNYEAARRWFEHAISYGEEKLGENDKYLIEPLEMLIAVEMVEGNTKSAEQLLRRAIRIAENSKVANFQDLQQRFDLYILLADIFTLRGDLLETERIYQTLIEAINKVETKNLPVSMTLKFLEIYASYIRVLDFLGEEDKVADLKAEFLNAFSKSGFLNSAENAGDPALRMTSEILHQYSLLLYRGNQEELEKGLEKAVAAQEKFEGAESGAVIEPLLNLGRIYMARGKYNQAQGVLNRAKSIFDKVLPGNSPLAATIDLQLAYLALLQNDFAKAEEISQRSLQIFEKSELGKFHPDTAGFRWFLGLSYQFQGKFTEAEKEFELAALSGQLGFGPRSQFTLAIKSSQVTLAQARGDYQKALRLQIENNTITEEKLRQFLTLKGEFFKQQGLADFARQLDHTISLQVNAGTNQEITDLALASVLQRKGRSLDAMANVYKIIRRRLSPENQKILDELSAKRTQLATLVIKNSGKTVPEELTKLVKELELEIGRLEGELTSRSREFRVQIQPVSPTQVRENLPPKSALIEFVLYRPINKKAKSPADLYEPPRYMAYLLTKTGETKSVDLGLASEIDTLGTDFRNLVGSVSSGLSRTKEAARKLDAAIMEPVRKLMTERPEHIFIAPDGNLNLIPFSALIDEQNKYLVENFLITFLSSGRELVQLPRDQIQLSEPVILGDPNYDWQETAPASEQPSSGSLNERRSGDYKNLRFGSLKGTAEEAAAMSKIYPKARLLLKNSATEKAVKSLKNPYFLHIATHGFFLTQQRTQAAEMSSLFSFPSDSQSSSFGEENPLLRSGIVLAGANNFQKNMDEDGILTAFEISALDLTGTKLVVLSACETGVGDIESGEGVYGLRRSLFLAGSETQIISLWKVSDNATRDLMIDFYQNLKAGKQRGHSLRQAQLKMLAQRNSEKKSDQRDRSSEVIQLGPHSNDRGQGFEHPFYWASFIQAGHW